MSQTDFAKETLPVALEDEMRSSYLDYAMSVIVGRALPDVRDGLKPVHRRLLFAMHEMSNDWNKPYKKSARIVGDVLGKYHPHGETALYEAAVRLAQPFNLRYPLIDGQGNFGSVDGDSAAASRYTEVRMSRLAHEMLADIDKNTVDFGPNYDGKEQEPLILPNRLPNLLINGSSGIAVGMATNIPPHNVGEVIDGCLALLKNPAISIEQLMQHILAPDFPTAGILYGLQGIRDGYMTGRGRVVIRARTHVESIGKSDRQAIVVDELPYQVNKAKLLERIGELVRDKVVDGISDLRDESDKAGMRVVIELKRGTIADIVLNQLYKLTSLQDSFGMNMVALVDGQPRLLDLKQVIEEFIRHRREVITRRTRFELDKAQNRAHVLEGLAVALSNVDEMIALIKAAQTPAEAKEALMSRPWRSQLVAELLESDDPKLSHHLSEAQAQAILELRLQRLTGLEQDKIVGEYKELLQKAQELLAVLMSAKRIDGLIEEELVQIKQQFNDKRRSEIQVSGAEIQLLDLIVPEDRVITLTQNGYIKAQAMDEYRAQKRGGRGKMATVSKDDDLVDSLFIANTHDVLLCFSSLGRCYWLKIFQVPLGGRTSRGKPIVNLLSALADGERITAVLPVNQKQFDDEHFVFMVTDQGVVKKVALTHFSNPRSLGIIAIDLDEGDQLEGAHLTDGSHQVMLFSDTGKAVRFDESEVRAMGRTARGVRGIRLSDGGRVIVSQTTPEQDIEVLTATETGYGKRTSISDFRETKRGSQGVNAIDSGGKRGQLIAVHLVHPDDELMLITAGGVMIRTRVSEVRQTSRTAGGVKLIQLEAGDVLKRMAKIVEEQQDVDVPSSGEDGGGL